MKEEIKQKIEEMASIYYMTCSECGHYHLENDVFITSGITPIYCDCGNILLPESFLLQHGNDITMSVMMDLIKNAENKQKYAFVYLLESDGCFKIGIAENVEKRIKQLQTGNSSKIKKKSSFAFERSIANYIENYFHNYFENNNIVSEWFKLDKEGLSFIIERLDKAQRLNSQLITAGLNYEEREKIIRSNFKKY